MSAEYLEVPSLRGSVNGNEYNIYNEGIYYEEIIKPQLEARGIYLDSNMTFTDVIDEYTILYRWMSDRLYITAKTGEYMSQYHIPGPILGAIHKISYIVQMLIRHIEQMKKGELS